MANRVKYALYKGAVMCEVKRIFRKADEKAATVVFDNHEVAVVPLSDLQAKFDLTEGCAA